MSVAAPGIRRVEVGYAAVVAVEPVRSMALRPLSAGRVEEARAALARAEANLRAARSRLDDRRLTAPFAGTLRLIDTDPGEYVDSTTVIGPLDDLSRVEVDFTLPERYFARVETGQTLRVTSAVYPDRAFEAEVSLRAPRIDDASRSFTVRAALDNPDRLLAGHVRRGRDPVRPIRGADAPRRRGNRRRRRHPCLHRRGRHRAAAADWPRRRSRRPDRGDRGSRARRADRGCRLGQSLGRGAGDAPAEALQSRCPVSSCTGRCWRQSCRS
ncbi:RND family efflux transporter, MFP subunit [Rhodovulum sp. ES.010]|uniref:efflux RND transporter periplasmic adaptor subunit n=1 Tax=Rhodovulum sp. ES.010 TaxID=1882821 RepID=UPI000927BD00|nr:efflux RND transporter periplasmic adaptor subunit [Rhodovulum sp. ES.010]SIO32301.1 RND family efflux transporter, MFP subunit [Rhodovulum sp. ES.010]